MSLVKSGLVIVLSTSISRVLGLVRELLLASVFGTTVTADAINTALKLPNLFRRIFGEGALSAVFIPIYSSELEVSKIKAKKFADEIFSFLVLVLTIITVIMQIYMSELMLLLAPGFVSNSEKFLLTVSLCQITMPYMLFISTAALIGGVLNSHKKFTAFAIMPVILNIAIVIGTIFPANLINKADIVAWSIALGGLAQFLFMYFVAYKNNIKLKITLSKNPTENCKTFFKNMLPATLSSGVVQLNLFISQSIASFVSGAISILAYADRIYQLPLAIIGICFGTILLPTLSSLIRKGEHDKVRELQTDALKLSLFLSLPCTAGIIALAFPIIHIIYERGAFLPEDSFRTAEALIAFALGLPAYIIAKVLTPIFFANMDVKTPFRITVLTIISNIILNLILVKPLEHIGIALGTSISSWINIILTVYYLRKNKIRILSSTIKLFALKSILASIIMAVAVYITADYLENYLYHTRIFIKAISLFISVVIGISSYLIVSVIFNVLKLKELKKLFNKNFI